MNERTLKQSYNEKKHMLVRLAEQGLAITGHYRQAPGGEGTQYFQFKIGNACTIVSLLEISIT